MKANIMIFWSVSRGKKQHATLSVSLYLHIPWRIMLDCHMWLVRTLHILILCSFDFSVIRVSWDSFFSLGQLSFFKSGGKKGAWEVERGCRCVGPLHSHFICSEVLGCPSTSPWHDFTTHNMEIELHPCLPTLSTQVVKANVYTGLCILWPKGAQQMQSY